MKHKKKKSHKHRQPNVTQSVEYVLENFVDFSIDDVKSLSKQVFSETLDTTFDVYINSQRYQLFKLKGCSCVVCGMTATRCELNVGGGSLLNRAHWNFVGDLNGIPTILTKDHIIPPCHGGKDVLENYQVMCMRCNNKKGTRLVSIENLKLEIETCDITNLNC
jgi:hypothetical protein